MTYPWWPAEGTDRAEPADAEGWMHRRMFDLRIVSLVGTLDDERANRLGAELMTLDATGDEPVQLRIHSGDGTIEAALTLVDVIDLLGVPVRAVCTGEAAGPALGVLAVCRHRTVSPHGRLRLFEPTIDVQGEARQIPQLASAHLRLWETFCARLSGATGQPSERIREDAAHGRCFTAPQAIVYGLADEVRAADARIYRLEDRPMGFGPR